jgi:hypothetical protein
MDATPSLELEVTEIRPNTTYQERESPMLLMKVSPQRPPLPIIPPRLADARRAELVRNAQMRLGVRWAFAPDVKVYWRDEVVAQVRGIALTAVLPRGVADRMGLEAGDVILQVDGQPMRSPGALLKALFPRDRYHSFLILSHATGGYLLRDATF